MDDVKRGMRQWGTQKVAPAQTTARTLATDTPSSHRGPGGCVVTQEQCHLQYRCATADSGSVISNLTNGNENDYNLWQQYKNIISTAHKKIYQLMAMKLA
jgi:hypothetical protein